MTEDIKNLKEDVKNLKEDKKNLKEDIKSLQSIKEQNESLNRTCATQSERIEKLEATKTKQRDCFG